MHLHSLGFLPGETLCGAAAARALCGGGPKARPVASGASCARGGGCADALSGLGFLSGETLCGAAAARALCGGGPKARPRGVWHVVRAGWRLCRCAVRLRLFVWRNSLRCRGGACAVRGRRAEGRPVASGALCARGGGCADVLSGPAFCLAKLFAVPRRRVRCAGVGRRPPPWRLARRARGGRLCRCAAWPRFLPGETLCGAAAARALCRGGGPKARPVASGALCARGGGCADAQPRLFAWRNSLRCRGGACAAALLIASRGRRGPRRGRRRTGARCRWRRPRCCRPCAPWRGSPGRQSASRRRARAPCSPRR